jgi:hypothetical protein
VRGHKRTTTSAQSVDMGSSQTTQFRVGETALVMCDRGDLIREGKIYDIQKVGDLLYYNIKFAGSRLPELLHNWFVEQSLQRKTPSSVLSQQNNYDRYVKTNVMGAPACLFSLIALRYTKLSDRAGVGLGRCRGIITYSDTSTQLGALKSTLLTIEAALPWGCIDDSDDRWSSSFSEAWRHAVVTASNAGGLMECQLSLEFAIKSGWIKPAGSKLLACLPSRSHCAKYATYGLVAIRAWTLDHILRYDKVALPNGDRSDNYKKEKTNRVRKSGL